MTQQEYTRKVVPHARRILLDLQRYLQRLIAEAERKGYKGDFDEMMEMGTAHFLRAEADRMDGQRKAVMTARELLEDPEEPA